MCSRGITRLPIVLMWGESACVIRSLGRRGGERRYEENDFFCLFMEYDSLRCMVVGSCGVCDRVAFVIMGCFCIVGSSGIVCVFGVWESVRCG